jgi:prepilin-type N-terminal cleavage/methylation domain-containing protein
MKTLSAKAKINGLTLIELLVVVVVITILFAMILPTSGPKTKSTLIWCLSNQRQIAIGFTIWRTDSNGQFPWQVSNTNGGTMEFADRGYAAPNFRVLSDYLKQTRPFVCPTDEIKSIATNQQQFDNQNLSYFVSFDAGTNDAASILTGDRHLEDNGKPVKPGLLIYSNGISMNWTFELHGKVKTAPVGVLTFVDGHGQIVHGTNLNSIFQQQVSITNCFAIP